MEIVEVVLALLLAVALIGAIFFGIATPTEAAAVGALGSILLAAAYRSLSFTNASASLCSGSTPAWRSSALR